MSTSQRVKGVKVLKAISSPLRLQVLNLLYDRGPISYTELMSQLRMNPSRDAGRFAYHLKFLLKTDLAETDAETKKYSLTELGKMVLDVADRIDKKALKTKTTLVRTSRLALEEFDTNKIANSLIKEAKMPAELAKKIAKEAEKQLTHSKTKYITAPLVRELVNAILIENGLEEYRHKLTRLGIPVHDVTNLLETRKTNPLNSPSIQELAGRTVLKEYTLLHTLPRDISDAHLSGAIHLDNVDSWILKPSEIMHDLRFFLERGSNLEATDPNLRPYPPPEDLEHAANLIFNALLLTTSEVNNAQTIDYFNVFLAPFTKSIQPAKIKQQLHLIISNATQHTNATLGLELSTPTFIKKETAIGPNGEHAGTYRDYEEQAQTLASLLIEVINEENAHKPITNLNLLIKIRPETYTDERAKALLLKAHKLAIETGSVSFAALMKKEQTYDTYSSTGFRLTPEPEGDWETDTVRNGLLGTATINMPRITHEAAEDKTKFFEILRERIEIANRALEIKHTSMKHRARNILPFLTQNENSDQYLRLDKCSNIINLAGLKETVEALSETRVTEEKALTLTTEIAQNISNYTLRTGKRRGKHAIPAVLTDQQGGERLAQVDIEKYGIAKVNYSGTREKPFYSTTNRVAINQGKLSTEALAFQEKTSFLCEGGNLTVVELNETKIEPNDLSAISRQLAENNISLFTYERRLSYCIHCRKSWYGLLRKCPSCGAMGTLVSFDRLAGT
jgi:anaerobic ribonucleoside-triphosphate reductase